MTRSPDSTRVLECSLAPGFRSFFILRLLHRNLPDESFPARRAASQEMKRVLRAVEQRVSLDDPLPQRLHDALLEQRRNDLRLEVVPPEFVLEQLSSATGLPAFEA